MTIRFYLNSPVVISLLQSLSLSLSLSLSFGISPNPSPQNNPPPLRSSCQTIFFPCLFPFCSLIKLFSFSSSRTSQFLFITYSLPLSPPPLHLHVYHISSCIHFFPLTHTHLHPFSSQIIFSDTYTLSLYPTKSPSNYGFSHYIKLFSHLTTPFFPLISLGFFYPCLFLYFHHSLGHISFFFLKIIHVIYHNTSLSKPFPKGASFISPKHTKIIAPTNI
ncbi:unnamed protein product [Acanthosepion pharaonis]|uniref:Uncharacterized protein n=1 Tax=Acanthosepion pharaonis TaxID=158019 RepID=A0A812E467_ACAPH|nr:unnamed protein product [Sepia pharaonis]